MENQCCTSACVEDRCGDIAGTRTCSRCSADCVETIRYCSWARHFDAGGVHIVSRLAGHYKVTSALCLLWFTCHPCALVARCTAQSCNDCVVIYFCVFELTQSMAKAKVCASSRHWSYRPDGPPCPAPISHLNTTTVSGDTDRNRATHLAGS